MNDLLSLGASYLGHASCRFRVWAPFAQRVEVHILEPRERAVLLEMGEGGYHQTVLDGVEPGALYMYRLDGQKERPDPASRSQPRGVHGPSQVVDPSFPWEDQSWHGLTLQEYAIYELHVGTFTDEGTFDAIIPHLDSLKRLGVTAVELMPVAQFPGTRNWGYDGVHPFAVQDSYGGTDGLKRLANACHKQGLALVLDVVLNHLGPEGNSLGDFGPYFTDWYRTPWGRAINFDGPHSDDVHRYFIENAIYWVAECHVDALRLDSVHAILDHSPRPFLQELGEVIQEVSDNLGRKVHLIAETPSNDARVVRPMVMGGYGLDAQWNDDFHHAIHTLLTGEQDGYYQDYGTLEYLRKAFSSGYVYTGEYSSYRQRRHGSSSRDILAQQLVVSAQNHDQVGNRAQGDRLSSVVPFEALKLAAGLVVLSPFVPLLFMGEEYGETAPFPYFVSHSDPGLVEAVRRGRREEFASFLWSGEVPDPQDETTFLRAKLNHRLAKEGHHRRLLEFYTRLFQLRKETSSLANLSKEDLEASCHEGQQVLLVRRWLEKEETAIVAHLGDGSVSTLLPLPCGKWRKALDSSDEQWGGLGSRIPDAVCSTGETSLVLYPWSLVVLTKKEA